MKVSKNARVTLSHGSKEHELKSNTNEVKTITKIFFIDYKCNDMSNEYINMKGRSDI